MDLGGVEADKQAPSDALTHFMSRDQHQADVIGHPGKIPDHQIT
jgi:hypothetical protein